MPSESEVIAQERLTLMDLMDKEPHRIPRREVEDNILIATWNIAQFSEKKTA